MREFNKLFKAVVIALFLIVSGCTPVQHNTISKSKRIKIALINYEMARNIIVHKDYKNLANAFKYLEEAQKTLKNDPRIYYLYAIAYQLRGNMRMYEFYLKKTIATDKNFFDAYNALGIYYYSLGEYQRAIEMFTKLIKNPLYPNADIAFYNRALVWLKLGKTKRALEDLRNAVIFSSYTNPTYFKALINLEIENKMYILALKDLESMEEHLGSSCFTKLKKALCYLNLKQFRQAVNELNKVKETTPNCQEEKNKLLEEIKNDNNTND